MELENIFSESVSARQIEIDQIIRDFWIIIKPSNSKLYTINDNGSIDVDGSVKLPRASSFLTHLPLTFNKVSGDFDCSRLSLITLKGCPIELGGTFDCSYNQLTSLEFAPKKANLFVFDNTIKSLSTNGQNCKFDEVLMLCRTNIPDVGLHPSIIQNSRQIKTVLHYQNYYDVWNDDQSLNEPNFDCLIADILDGLE